MGESHKPPSSRRPSLHSYFWPPGKTRRRPRQARVVDFWYGQAGKILELDGDTFRLVATHGGDAVVRAVPFDAIELELAALWER